ncbi:imidazole glycerol phosphate synthase subunit HisH [Robertkochia marina]|uniref:Imidazole glycerol phosphate synthase subunit HisH n=1 Tax=Robertkochia marina TaxID=1227945 RepID=A0A4S3M0L1_9FLAO|nr:imidazole glycerol phosphate synthase subunit HisH [Robertkochia marina]THD67924.1 imidazole glycerol phosphate synthase subunit HisH [Robertkochia marina]TRZ41030.1 imidazole glycerol phosphate synthase subunit HisH [Robertkochia marina]
MKVSIIDYGAGNIQSLIFAFNRLGVHPVVTDHPKLLAEADRVIFPGVGEAGSAMAKLRQHGLEEVIPQLKQPVLGICLGMQLMCAYSEEGDTRGLGIFDCEVKHFDRKLKVPQIGWNTITNLKSPLFKGIEENSYMYLVHSYYVANNPHSIATTKYGETYASALHRNNFYGTQFHPEKSGEIGAKVLENFLNLKD